LRRQQCRGFAAHLRDQISAHKRRRYSKFVFAAVVVGAHPFQLRGIGEAIPTPIVAPVARAQFVVCARDRVPERLKPFAQEERIIGKHRPAGFRRKIGFVRRAAPNVIAGIVRLRRRRELGAHARPKTVASDQEIGFFSAAVGEMDSNAAAILLDALERMPKMIALAIDRLEQGLAQPIPRRNDLQLRLFRDDIAAAVECDALVNDNADIDRAGATSIQSFEQFQMSGKNADATADQLDG
jgi:hypothetical protein